MFSFFYKLVFCLFLLILWSGIFSFNTFLYANTKYEKLYQDYSEKKIRQHVLRKHIKKNKHHERYLNNLLGYFWEKAILKKDNELKLLLISSYHSLGFYESISTLNPKGSNYPVYNYYFRNLIKINSDKLFDQFVIYLLYEDAKTYSSQGQYHYLFKAILEQYSWKIIEKKIQNLSTSITKNKKKSQKLLLVFFAYYHKQLLSLYNELISYHEVLLLENDKKQITLIEKYFSKEKRKIIHTFVEYSFTHSYLLDLFKINSKEKFLKTTLQTNFFAKKYKETLSVAKKNNLTNNFYYKYSLFKSRYQKASFQELERVIPSTNTALSIKGETSNKEDVFYYYWLNIIEKKNARDLLKYYSSIDITELSTIQLLTFDWIIEFQSTPSLLEVFENLFKVLIDDSSVYLELENKKATLPKNFFEYLVVQAMIFSCKEGDRKRIDTLYNIYKDSMTSPLRQEAIIYYYAKSLLFEKPRVAIKYLQTILYQNSKTPYRLQIERDLRYFSEVVKQ